MSEVWGGYEGLVGMIGLVCQKSGVDMKGLVGMIGMVGVRSLGWI